MNTFTKLLCGSALALLSSVGFADELPAANEFWYCGHFYQWANSTLTDQTALKAYVTSAAKLFRAGAVILSDGTPNLAEFELGGRNFKATLKAATEANQKVGDLFKSLDDQCMAKQRRYAMALLKKNSEVTAAQQAYFTHGISPGAVTTDAIAKRQEFIKSRPGVSVVDQGGMLTYSFTRSVGDMRETAFHVFTKEGHPAHPALLFLLKQRASETSKPSLTNSGSYAGSEKEFDDLRTMLVLANGGI